MLYTCRELFLRDSVTTRYGIHVTLRYDKILKAPAAEQERGKENEQACLFWYEQEKNG